MTAAQTAPLPLVADGFTPGARLTIPSRVALYLPLLAVLAAQAALTVRLIPDVGSDHSDEAIYLYGGTQLIRELLHGGGSPYYETWYSGAPVLYPVIAAVAAKLGGLLLARWMSVAFMLAATSLLFLTARRLFGYWTGVAAAGLFAGLGVTQNLGALATFDAMSLMLLALAAYCAARSAVSARWLLTVPLALLAANAAKYVTVLFDPVVIGLAALQLAPLGWRRSAQRILSLSAASGVLTGTVLLLAGSGYIQGIMFTTLSRQGGAQADFGSHFATAAQVASLTWQWTGAVVALGALALLVPLLRRTGGRTHVLVLLLLLAAGLLVTAGNARLHTAQSMDKHDDFSAWFACIPAAYALAHLTALARGRAAKALVFAVAAATAGLSGWHYSQPSDLSGYFSAVPLASYHPYAFLNPYLKPGGEEYLLGSKYSAEMAEESGITWWQYFDDIYVKYPVPGRGGDAHGQASGLACGGSGQPLVTVPGCVYLEDAAGYAAAIRAHWFALVTLDGNHGLGTDAAILAAVRSVPGYVQVSDQGGAPTFIYTPDYPAWEKAHPAAPRQVPEAQQAVHLSDAVNCPHASTLTVSVPPSRLVVSRTRTTGSELATSTQPPPPEPE